MVDLSLLIFGRDTVLSRVLKSLIKCHKEQIPNKWYALLQCGHLSSSFETSRDYRDIAAYGPPTKKIHKSGKRYNKKSLV